MQVNLSYMKILPQHLIILLICLLTSCSGHQEDKSAERLVIRLEREPLRLGEIFNTTDFERQVNEYLFLSLGDYDPETLELIPVLAKELPTGETIVDGEYNGLTKYSIELLDEAVWPNGSPITGYDFDFTLKVVRLPNVDTRWKNVFDNIVDIQVDDQNPKRFSIISDGKYFLTRETILTAEVYPRYVYDADEVLTNIPFDQIISDQVSNDSLVLKIGQVLSSAKYTKSPALVGSGPYELRAWEAGQFIILNKKENWWGSKYPDRSYLHSYPQQIIFQILGDATTGITQMKNDEIDLINLTRSPFTVYDDLKNDESFSARFDFYSPSIFRVYYLLLNNEDPRLSDVNVRMALAHAVNIDQLINQQEGGYGQRSASFIHPSKSEYNSQLQFYEYDPGRASQLLKDAGWGDSNGDGTIDKQISGLKYEMSLRFFISGSPLSQSIATILKESVADLGIEIDIITKSSSLTRSENWRTGDFEIGASAITQSADRTDPFSFVHSSAITGGGINYSRISNNKVDSLCDIIRSTQDEAERSKAYKDLQEVLYTDMPFIVLYAPLERMVVSKEFEPVLSPKRPGYFANSFEQVSL